jgi:hypothetical protein
MLYRDDNSPDNLRKGLLIDFDYAFPLDRKGQASAGDRTGTGPFMALEVLAHADDHPIQQTPQHDLESIFYVLLYICSKFKGPKNLKRSSKEDKGLDINAWFSAVDSYHALWLKKFGALSRFEELFISKFMPYFVNLGDCILGLWNELYPTDTLAEKPGTVRILNKCVGTHEGMLKVLHSTYEELPLNETCISTEDQLDITFSPRPEIQSEIPLRIMSQTPLQTPDVSEDEEFNKE